MAYDFDLFVIGGGSAGVRCARISAGHGAKVAIAEERFWGGTCVNIGCVPKKLLVQAGEYGAWADDAAGFGWTIKKGPHDWAKLIAAKDREIGRLKGVYRRMLDAGGATAFEARAVLVDPHTIEVAGRRVTAEHIVVAVGGHPVRPDIPGAALGIVSDDAFYLPSMPRRIVIVGGGYIAVEFAGIFAHLGAGVDLVYRQMLPLRGFDEDLREGLAGTLQADGIKLHPGAQPHRLEKRDGGKRLTLSTGVSIDADLVFFATGRKPHTEGLGLRAAGVATNPVGAITVDAQLRTSIPHIYAMGDVTDRLNLTPIATAEGHAVADALFARKMRHVSLDNVPTAVFSTPPCASCGLTEEAAAMRGPVDVYVAHFTPMRHAISGRGRRTMMKLVVDQKTQVVVGTHMLGEDAPEIMQGLAVAMACGATKADFDRTIGIHPTAAEEFVTMRTRTRVAGVAQAAE